MKTKMKTKMVIISANPASDGLESDTRGGIKEKGIG